MSFEDRVAKELSEVVSNRVQATDRARHRNDLLHRGIVQFRDSLREALSLLERRVVSMVPIAQPVAIGPLTDRRTKYRWSGHSGWGLGNYVAINGVLVPTLGAYTTEMPIQLTSDLRRELTKLPRVLSGKVWCVSSGRLPTRGTSAVIQEPSGDETLSLVGNTSVIWDRPHSGGKRVSASLTAEDSLAPFRLGAADQLEIRLFYSYYTEYRPAEDWLVKAVASAIDEAAS